MPISAHVFRWSLGDCTAGGISQRADQLLVLNAGGDYWPAGHAEMPHCLIVPGAMPGIIRAVPAGSDGQPVKEWVMMGGNYLASSDARFREACENALRQSWEESYARSKLPVPSHLLGACKFYGAVAIHDRIER